MIASDTQSVNERQSGPFESLSSKPTALLEALAKATGEIEKLSKANFNKFDKFNFTSIDDFLSATAPVCSRNGLIVLQEETAVAPVQRKDSIWLRFEFAFMVCHVSGETLGPFRRTVSVADTGSQCFGSAQSYSLKQFLRSLLQIPTGDGDDPDHQPSDRNRPVAQGSSDSKPATQKQKDLILATSSKTGAFESEDQFRQWLIRTKKNLDELTTSEASSLITFLVENPDPSKWPDSVQPSKVIAGRQSSDQESDATQHQLNQIVSFAMENGAFESEDQFYDWLSKTKRKKLIDFSESEATDLIVWLTENPDPATWPDTLKPIFGEQNEL